MALIKCRNCGHEISDTTKKCIHCGTKIKKPVSKKKEKINFDNSFKTKKIVKHEGIQKHNKKKMFNKIILIIMFILLCVIILLFILSKIYNDKFVSIKFKDGNFSKVIKIEKGDTIQEIKISNRKGYKFNGWYLGNKKYNFNKKVTSDIILIGKWLKIYSVEFDSNGGSSIDIQKVTKGEKVTKPEDPTRDGYDFVNWYLNDKEYNFDDKITSNTKLVAKWNEKPKIESNTENNIANNSNQTFKNNDNNSNVFKKSNQCTLSVTIQDGNSVLVPVDGYYHVNTGSHIAISWNVNAEVGSLTNISVSFSSNSSDILEQSFESSFYAKSSGIATITMNYSGCDNGSRQFTFVVS